MSGIRTRIKRPAVHFGLAESGRALRVERGRAIDRPALQNASLSAGRCRSRLTQAVATSHGDLSLGLRELAVNSMTSVFLGDEQCLQTNAQPLLRKILRNTLDHLRTVTRQPPYHVYVVKDQLDRFGLGAWRLFPREQRRLDVTVAEYLREALAPYPRLQMHVGWPASPVRGALVLLTDQSLAQIARWMPEVETAWPLGPGLLPSPFAGEQSLNELPTEDQLPTELFARGLCLPMDLATLLNTHQLPVGNCGRSALCVVHPYFTAHLMKRDGLNVIMGGQYLAQRIAHTALHEIGHAVGLSHHRKKTPALMNDQGRREMMNAAEQEYFHVMFG